MVQKVAVIIIQTASKYWILIMTVAASSYFDENPMFEGVISSFSTPTTDGPSERVPEAIMIALVIVLVAAVAVPAVMVMVALGIRPRHGVPKTSC